MRLSSFRVRALGGGSLYLHRQTMRVRLRWLLRQLVHDEGDDARERKRAETKLTSRRIARRGRRWAPLLLGRVWTSSCFFCAFVGIQLMPTTDALPTSMEEKNKLMLGDGCFNPIILWPILGETGLLTLL